MGAGIVSEAVTIHGRGDAVMFGVISRPAMKAGRPRSLVMLGKTGPGDIWRWLAESLARRGFVVLRFEPAGLGDSPGGEPGVDVPMEEYFRGVQEGAFTENTEDVVSWVKREYDPSELSVLGICGSCSSVLLAAATLRHVVTSVILVTPAVLYSTARTTMRNYEAQAMSRMYLKRLFDPAAYSKFLTGHSDYHVIRTVFLWLLWRPVDVARRAMSKLDRSPRPTHPGFNWRFWKGLRAVMNQGKPILCLIAEMDAEALDFDAELKGLVLDRDREYSRLCAVRLLPRTDHSFLFDEGRQLARDAVVEWLDRSPESTKMGVTQSPRGSKIAVSAHGSR